ncbi:MAG: TM2 domain-containing protein [Oligoflexus sp.]|nr:TM2 domain-containing protein [Oligoflexus sp.]
MQTPKSTHSVLLGYVLWIFGFTGSHRFYYGKKITGALWFCTLGLLGIGWLIDVFLIPSMDRKAELRYQDGPYDYNVAWILQTFLGIFGIHRFYLGKFGTGLLYLLTGGLLGIGWLYDFFMLNEIVSDKNREQGAEGVLVQY